MADETPGTTSPSGFFSKPPQRPVMAPAAKPAAAPPPSPTAGEPASVLSMTLDTTPRPWMRWSARVMDYMIGGLVVGFVLGLVAPAVAKRLPGIVMGMIVAFVWVFVEAVLLSTWGTTPGKWMFPTIVRTRGGALLDGGSSIGRAFAVWIRGFGLGIPIVSLVTEVKAYNRLKARGDTSWDADGRFVVSHEPQTAAQKAVIVVAVVILLGVGMLGAMAK